MASVSHGFPRLGREQQKERRACTISPYFAATLFSFLLLTSAIVLEFTVHLLWQGPAKQGNIIPSYSSQLLHTVHGHPGWCTIEFGWLCWALGLQNPISLSHYPAWTHHVCAPAAVPGTTPAVFAAPFLFASPSTSPLPRAGHLAGHGAGPKGLWWLIHPQRLLPGHRMPRGAQEHHRPEQPAARAQPGAPRQWAPSQGSGQSCSPGSLPTGTGGNGTGDAGLGCGSKGKPEHRKENNRGEKAVMSAACNTSVVHGRFVCTQVCLYLFQLFGFQLTFPFCSIYCTTATVLLPLLHHFSAVRNISLPSLSSLPTLVWDFLCTERFLHH